MSFRDQLDFAGRPARPKSPPRTGAPTPMWDRGTETMARDRLEKLQLARLKAMLERGLTEDGAAQALGWVKARVTARVKRLELPDRPQELVGAGALPLSAVDQLRSVLGPYRDAMSSAFDALDTMGVRSLAYLAGTRVVGCALVLPLGSCSLVMPTKSNLKRSAWPDGSNTGVTSNRLPVVSA